MSVINSSPLLSQPSAKNSSLRPASSSASQPHYYNLNLYLYNSPPSYHLSLSPSLFTPFDTTNIARHSVWTRSFLPLDSTNAEFTLSLTDLALVSPLPSGVPSASPRLARERMITPSLEYAYEINWSVFSSHLVVVVSGCDSSVEQLFRR